MRRREAATGLLLASPAVVGLLAFLVLPFGYTFLRSFTTGLGWGRFVGLENYAQLFGNRLFLLALKNTFLFLACGLALILPLSLFLALLLQKTGKWGKGLAMALLFPMVLPASAIVIVVNLVFAENGLLGRISQHTGMSANTVAKYIRQLEEKRLIDTQPTKVKTRAGLVRNGNLLYMIRPIQEAVNYKLEKDLAALPEQKRPRKKR